MIARIFRGVTLASKAERYLEYLNKIVLPRYQATDGYQGIFVLREFRGELAHFLLLSFWESGDELLKNVGPDMEIAKHSPGEENILIAFESIVNHYEVLSRMEYNR